MTDAATEHRITEKVRKSRNSFMLLGALFVLGGILAIALPELSSLATSLVVGLLLAACGVLQIVQAFRTQGWQGFVWHLATGIIQMVGGAVIYFDPFAGAVAITLVIAAVLVAHGAAEVALAFRVRPFDGWGWLLLAGLVAIGAGAAIAVNLPVAGLSVPGTLVGLSLIFTGAAYIAIALAARRIVIALNAS